MFRLGQHVRRQSSAASRHIACLASARPGNLVRFVSPTGSELWGQLLEGEGEVRRAKVFKGVPGAADTSEVSSEEAEIAKVLPPIPVDPAPAIIVMGLNYRSHAKETGQELPRFPVFAFKNPASVIGPEVPVSIPKVAREKPEVDFEAELAIVIGRKVRDATPEEALDSVLGVTGANDVSARRWQGKKGGGQWSRAKSFDTFCPLGPTLLPVTGATADAVNAGLQVRSWVNGKAMQDGNTSDMEFGLGAIISYLSQGTTLLRGTVILTGTPPGVGYVRKPPVYLQPGDEVEVELEHTGRLRNPVESGP